MTPWLEALEPDFVIGEYLLIVWSDASAVLAVTMRCRHDAMYFVLMVHEWTSPAVVARPRKRLQCGLADALARVLRAALHVAATQPHLSRHTAGLLGDGFGHWHPRRKISRATAPSGAGWLGVAGGRVAMVPQKEGKPRHSCASSPTSLWSHHAARCPLPRHGDGHPLARWPSCLEATLMITCSEAWDFLVVSLGVA